MRKSLLQVALASILAGMTILLVTPHHQESPIHPYVTTLTAAQLQQYTWSPGEISTRSFETLLSQGNPLLVVWHVWEEYWQSRNAKVASRQLDQIIAKYDLVHTNKLTYPGYQALAAGWWSGMDQFFMPLVLVMISEQTGSVEYRALAENMLDLALKSPTEGGSMWPDNGEGCWLSEYSWDGMTRADEYYVLNGHLFALTSLKILANALHSPRLNQAYTCALAGTVSRLSRFNKLSKWPRYMLNPVTIDPPHYVLYEMMQFGGLYALTGDRRFLAQMQRRQETLGRYYPVYRVRTRSGQDAFFSSSGNPHPYLLDLFDIQLKCWNDKEQVTYSSDKRAGVMMGTFVMGPMPAGATCSVSSVYNGRSYELYRTNWFREVNADDRGIVLASQPVPSLDATEGVGGWITIDPAVTSSTDPSNRYLDSEARLTFHFPLRPLADQAVLAMEIETDGPLKLLVRLSNKDRTIERYLPPLSPGTKEVVPFSKLGFDGGDTFGDFDTLTLVVLTDGMSQKANVRVDKITLAANQYELFRTLQYSDALPRIEQ